MEESCLTVVVEMQEGIPEEEDRNSLLVLVDLEEAIGDDEEMEVEKKK